MVLVALCAAALSAASGCGDGRSVALDGGPLPGESEPNTTPPPGMCFVDFPCAQDETMHCAGPTTYYRTETFDCTHYCDEPCSGAACEDVGPERSCPAGQVCIRGDWGMGDHCGVPDAGGPKLDIAVLTDGGGPKLDTTVLTDGGGPKLDVLSGDTRPPSDAGPASD